MQKNHRSSPIWPNTCYSAIMLLRQKRRQNIEETHPGHKRERERERDYNALASQQVWSHIEEDKGQMWKTSRQSRTNLKTCIWFCCAKKSLMVFVSVENKGAYRCLTAWRAGHSKIMCNSSATATLPQCVQTLLALATCWPPAKRPRMIGSWWEPSLNCRNRCMRLPETGSWQYRLCRLKGLNQWWYVHATTPTEGAALGQCGA